ncbi:MAG: DUF4176 domain-containing protein [Lachnospiraceae bacterium]|nr:DUF4176 domain-containing protein [Lachnospiraceae bacterium]
METGDRGRFSVSFEGEDNMYGDLMPCGSVVKLTGGERYVLICGRVVFADGDDHVYDYTGCLYPEGIACEDKMLFFDRDTIERILFVGFQDRQELEYREQVLDSLGELKVVKGEII